MIEEGKGRYREGWIESGGTEEGKGRYRKGWIKSGGIRLGIQRWRITRIVYSQLSLLNVINS